MAPKLETIISAERGKRNNPAGEDGGLHFYQELRARLQDIIRNAVIQVDIGLPVDQHTLVFGEKLAPGLAVAVDGPVIPVEPSPEDGPAIFIHSSHLTGKGDSVMGSMV